MLAPFGLRGLLLYCRGVLKHFRINQINRMGTKNVNGNVFEDGV